MREERVCVGDHVADSDPAAATVQARVYDPGPFGEGVGDRGDHANAAGMTDRADIGREDVEGEGGFEDGFAGPWRED